MLLFIVFVTVFSFGAYGFLFDNTTPRSNGVGTGLTDTHYIAVMDMLVQEKQLREHYMLQLKQKVLENENKTSFLESKINNMNQSVKNNSGENDEITFLKNITATIIQNYQILENKHVDLQKNYATLESTITTIRRDCSSTNQKLKIFENELTNLRKLQSINQTLAIQDLQNENMKVNAMMKDTKHEIESVKSMQQARGEDFLALYNATVEVNSKMKGANSQIDVVTLDVEEAKRSIRSLEYVTGQLSIQQNVTSTKLDQEMKQVAVTSCVSYGPVANSQPMKFPLPISSYGFRNLTAFHNSGVFTCETDGLYLISLTVMCNVADSYFHIYKNTQYLIDAYADSHDHIFMTASATVVVQLRINDVISVKPDRESFVYASPPSRLDTCITIVKIQ